MIILDIIFRKHNVVMPAVSEPPSLEANLSKRGSEDMLNARLQHSTLTGDWQGAKEVPMSLSTVCPNTYVCNESDYGRITRTIAKDPSE